MAEFEIVLEGFPGLMQFLNLASNNNQPAKDLLEALSDETEVEAKNLVQVISGQLWSSIGNHSKKQPKMPSTPELDPKRQAEGKTQAIWRSRSIGGEYEVEMGTAVEHKGDYYSPPAEFSGRTGKYVGRSHFMEDGAKAALNGSLEDIAEKTVFRALESAVNLREYHAGT